MRVAQNHDFYRIPFLIGVVGHRDLVADEISAIRDAIRTLLSEIRDRHPNVRPTLLCSMAEGADLLAAEVAAELGVSIIALLPFPATVCRAELPSEADRVSFDRICAGAEVLELPVRGNPSAEELSQSHDLRDRQFQHAGLLVARYSALLIAVWDGKDTNHRAGTARVIEYRRRGMPDELGGMALPRNALLTPEDNDLIYEISCSRKPGNGNGERTLPLPAPRFVEGGKVHGAEWPYQLQATLAGIGEFNRDVEQFSAEIDVAGRRLCPPSPYAIPERLQFLDGLFTAADWLGRRFRVRFVRALAARYSLWAVMATLLIVFKKESQELQGLLLMSGVLFAFGLGALLARLARRGAWHRKYLDYRALAEGLRVEYYWEIAGVPRESSGFAHDSFLQKQDVELEWIRAAMRAVSLRLELRRGGEYASGFTEAYAQWIGDEDPVNGSGQLLYYSQRHRRLKRRLEGEEHAQRFLQVVGFAIASVFLVDVVSELAHRPILPVDMRVTFLWALALLTVYAAIFEVYVTEKADRGLMRQYRYMHELFAHAARELRTLKDTGDKLAVLRELGEACLAEHAQWTLAHRDRRIEGLKW